MQYVSLGRSTSGSLCLEIFSPNPPGPIFSDCGGAVVANLEIDLIGQYVAVVSSPDSSTPIYSLSLTKIDPAEGQPIAFGPAVSEMIAPEADIDLYSIELAAGSLVRLDATDSTPFIPGLPNPSVCLEIFAPSATFEDVVPACDDIMVRQDFSVTESGLYSLVIGEQNHDRPLTDYSLGVECLIGPCPDPPPGCLIDLSYSDSTLTIDFVLSNPEAARWDLYLTTLFGNQRIITSALGEINPPVSFSAPIPNFPSLGEVVVWNSLSTAAGVICADLDSVDTGPLGGGAAAALDLSQIGVDIQGALKRVEPQK